MRINLAMHLKCLKYITGTSQCSLPPSLYCPLLSRNTVLGAHFSNLNHCPSDCHSLNQRSIPKGNLFPETALKTVLKKKKKELESRVVVGIIFRTSQCLLNVPYISFPLSFFFLPTSHDINLMILIVFTS